jgi:hypothetical protein
MSDEFFSPSATACIICTAWRAPFLAAFSSLALLALAIFPLTGCGDKHENKPDPARAVRYVVVGTAQPFPRWKEPVRSMPTMKRP